MSVYRFDTGLSPALEGDQQVLLGKQFLPLALLLSILVAPVSALAQFVGGGASASAWNNVLAAARKEGKVALYGAAVPAVFARLKPDFESAYPGIVLEINRIDSGPMLSKLEQERATGADGADIMISTEVMWIEARDKERALLPVVGPELATWPVQFMRGAKTIPIIALEPIIMAYNTNLVKTPITGFQDLLRPEFKDRVGTSTLAATVLIAWYDWLDKTQGADYTAKLAAQKPKMYAGTIGNTQALAAGEIAVTAFSNPSTALPMIALGAPIKVVFPTPGFGIRYATGIFGWAKRPNAAQVLMNYLLSHRGQVAWAGPGGTASPLPNIPGTVDAKTIEPFDPSKYPPEVVKAYTEKWDRLFK